jgi:hypothetical protein
MKHSPVFLSYYIFSASVMHVTSREWCDLRTRFLILTCIQVSAFPDDPQARSGLTKCMELLKHMSTIWPSAGRALELLQGSRVHSMSNGVAFPPAIRHKRSADQSLDNTFSGEVSDEKVHHGAADGDVRYHPAGTLYAIPQGHAPTFTSSYNWTDTMPFTDGLSTTSGLYPYYSTGFPESASNGGDKMEDGIGLSDGSYAQWKHAIPAVTEGAYLSNHTGHVINTSQPQLFLSDQYTL